MMVFLVCSRLRIVCIDVLFLSVRFCLQGKEEEGAGEGSHVRRIFRRRAGSVLLQILLLCRLPGISEFYIPEQGGEPGDLF